MNSPPDSPKVHFLASPRKTTHLFWMAHLKKKDDEQNTNSEGGDESQLVVRQRLCV